MTKTGGIVAAALVCHAPPVIMPPEVRSMLSGGGADTTFIETYKDLRRLLDETRPDTFVIFDTHWTTTTEHIVAGAEHHRGVYTSDELPLLMSDVAYDYPGAPELAIALERVIEARGQTIGAVGGAGASPGLRVINATNAHLPKHYGTLNVLRHLHRGEKVLSTGICQSAQVHNFLDFGAAIAEAAVSCGERVALFASGGMSHRFWPLDEIFAHGSFSPDHIRTPEARAQDEHIIGLWERGDHASVIAMYPEYRSAAPEGKFGHYFSLLGALGGSAFSGKGRKISAYENALGTGQVHVWFDVAGGVA